MKFTVLPILTLILQIFWSNIFMSAVYILEQVRLDFIIEENTMNPD